MAYKSRLGKRKKTEQIQGEDDANIVEEQPASKMKRFREGYVNKQHVLVMCSKGISHRYRHLMKDLRELLPHSKKDVKMDSRQMSTLNEICEMKNCTSCIFFEARRRSDLYMWVSKTPEGPSMKFLVRNVHTMSELKFSGNCLKGSRPIVHFDANFDSTPHYQLIKEVLMQAFPTPHYHPKSKPFFDHIFNFYIHDDHIWFRNYQVTPEYANSPETGLVEIGPRFVLYPVKILSGSFFGNILYENPRYVPPSALRGMKKVESAKNHLDNIAKAKESKKRAKKLIPTLNRTFLETIFDYEEGEFTKDDNGGNYINEKSKNDNDEGHSEDNNDDETDPSNLSDE